MRKRNALFSPSYGNEYHFPPPPTPVLTSTPSASPVIVKQVHWFQWQPLNLSQRFGLRGGGILSRIPRSPATLPAWLGSKPVPRDSEVRSTSSPPWALDSPPQECPRSPTVYTVAIAGSISPFIFVRTTLLRTHQSVPLRPQLGTRHPSEIICTERFVYTAVQRRKLSSTVPPPSLFGSPLVAPPSSFCEFAH